MRRRYAEVPLHELTPGRNVRHELGDLTDLADSIRRFGILQPLVCCPSEDGARIEVLFGQRRLAAARLAGNVVKAPCLLGPRPPVEEYVLTQLAENMEREDMTPIEEAEAIRDLRSIGLSAERIAEVVHRSKHWVSMRTRLLELPDALRLAVDVRWVSPAAALEWPRDLPAAHDPSVRARLAKVVRRGDGVLRQFLREEFGVAGRAKAILLTRIINVTVEAHDVAVSEARLAGLSVAAWTSEAILKAAAAD